MRLATRVAMIMAAALAISGVASTQADEIAARWPAGDALFRGHFECFLTPPLDEWFGFDAFPPATDAARKRRAAAEAYAPPTATPWSTAARPTASSASSSTCASATCSTPICP
ncbi:hypothetical protein JL720_14412 [Aureococcus anophagefferens]|nr:hypothetical protein JL720_14412 [Aureococcus anophagefferens]